MLSRSAASLLALHAGPVLFCSLFCGSVRVWLHRFRAVRWNGERERERERLRWCVLSGVPLAVPGEGTPGCMQEGGKRWLGLAWLDLNGIAVA